MAKVTASVVFFAVSIWHVRKSIKFHNNNNNNGTQSTLVEHGLLMQNVQDRLSLKKVKQPDKQCNRPLLKRPHVVIQVLLRVMKNQKMLNPKGKENVKFSCKMIVSARKW